MSGTLAKQPLTKWSSVQIVRPMLYLKCRMNYKSDARLSIMPFHVAVRRRNAMVLELGQPISNRTMNRPEYPAR